MNNNHPCNTPDGIDVSVVIPVHNEEGCLQELHQRLSATFARIDKSYEIVFVDDGSYDQSLQWIRKFAADDPSTRYLSLARNFGQSAAVAAGQRAARGRAIVTMDADLQNPPEEIPKLLAKFDEGYEVVYGIRRHRKDTLFRRLSSNAFDWFLRKIVKIPGEPCLTAFMVTHRRIIDELNQCGETTRFYPTLCAWLGARTARVNIQHDARQHGISKYNYRRLVQTAINLLTGYSNMPLKLASWLGGGMIIFGMLSMVAVIAQSGAATTLSQVLIVVAAMTAIGGLQLIGIGILGEYIGRIYTQSLGRPMYVVREANATSAHSKPAAEVGVPNVQPKQESSTSVETNHADRG